MIWNSATLKAVTWNVHGCVGSDGLLSPERTAGVLSEIDADLVALQEIDCRRCMPDGSNQLEFLARSTGLHATTGVARYEGEQYFGNALLTRHPAIEARYTDLSLPGREPRGLIDAMIRTNFCPLRALVTHFGLRGGERRAQLERLLKVIEATPHTPLMVLGDFNEWRPKAWTLLQLHATLGHARHVRSFPSCFPLLALDRVWFNPPEGLRDIQVHRSRTARVASDHLPVVASIDLSVAPRVPTSTG